MSEQEISMSPSDSGKQQASSPAEKKKDMRMDAEGPDLTAKVKDLDQKEILDAVLAIPSTDLIPWEPCTFPSLGYYYNNQIPNGKVNVKPMGLQAEKVLATQRLATTGYSLDYLFKECVQLPEGFDPLDLLVGDRTFLLYYIRGITHGNMYEFAVTCSNDDCKSMSTHTYDLNLLADTIVHPQVDETEPFKVVLPYLSKVLGRDFWVKIRFMRGRDIQRIWERQRFDKKISGVRNAKGRQSETQIAIDQSLEQNLNLIIVEAMGDKSPNKIQSLVAKLHAKDTATIREFIRENQPGIDTTINVTCPDCSIEMTLDLPISEGFFRPARSGDAGT